MFGLRRFAAVLALTWATSITLPFIRRAIAADGGDPAHGAPATTQNAPTAVTPVKPVLHLPSAQEPLSELELCLGRQEFEYVEIDCATGAEVGDVRLMFSAPTDFHGRASLLVEDEYRLLPRERITLRAGERNPIWIVFSTHGAGEGRYRFRLSLQPPDAPPTTLDIALVVLPIDCPRLDDVYVNAFWSGFFCIFGGQGRLFSDVRDPDRMMQLWERCVQDQRDWGQNMLEVRFMFGSREDALLGRYIRVVRFEKGYLPVLDLSGWDPILDVARRNGMRHVVFRYGYLAPSWRPPDYEKLAPEQQREVDFYILSQLMTHLRSRGFDRIFWYLMDEIRPYASVVDPVIENMVAHRKAFPDLEFAGSGFANHSLHDAMRGDGTIQGRGLEHLAPHLGWMAPYWNVQSVFRWLQSGELKLAPRGIIATQVAAIYTEQRYIYNRRYVWPLWLAGGTGYQIYGYHHEAPEVKYSAVLAGTDGPVYTPEYASLVDAHEDFQYLQLCSKVIRDLRAGGNAQRADAFQSALDSIVGREDSLLPLKFKPPARYDWGRAPIPYLECDEAGIRLARRRIMELLLEFQDR